MCCVSGLFGRHKFKYRRKNCNSLINNSDTVSTSNRFVKLKCRDLNDLKDIVCSNAVGKMTIY